MEDKLKEKFIIEPLKVKYYFDYDKNRLFCMIKMNYNNYSLNIIDNTNNFNGVYITRDKEEETKYISELSKYGFSLDIKKKYYYLENDRIIEFLEKGLNEISSKYETYISKKVKTSLHSRMKEGLYVSGRCPFGYMKDPNNKNKLLIDPVASEIVKEIFSLYRRCF